MLVPSAYQFYPSLLHTAAMFYLPSSTPTAHHTPGPYAVTATGISATSKSGGAEKKIY